MSAAEPVDPTRAPVNSGGDAAVIDISRRTGKPAAKGRRRHVNTPTPQPGASGGQSPQRMLAEHVEATFNHHHLSLTDEMTATAFTVTLELARGALAGAVAEGVIDEEQLAELDITFKGMTAAPRLVEGG